MRAFNAENIPKPQGDFTFVEKLSWPVTIEIGCGVGKHPLQWAKENPDKQMVAIERTKEKFRKFENSYVEAGSPENLFIVHGDAVAWVAHFVPPAMIL